MVLTFSQLCGGVATAAPQPLQVVLVQHCRLTTCSLQQQLSRPGAGDGVLQCCSAAGVPQPVPGTSFGYYGSYKSALYCTLYNYDRHFVNLNYDNLIMTFMTV